MDDWLIDRFYPILIVVLSVLLVGLVTAAAVRFVVEDPTSVTVRYGECVNR